MTGEAESAGPAASGGLGALADAASAGRGPAPVHLWNPVHCGEIDIRIRRDGSWWHEGAPIRRDALVRLFARVLRLDPDGFHLVTPAEKMRITVDDAPFLAVRLDSTETGTLRFTTNVGDEVEAGPAHALRVETDPVTGEPAPYLHVRRGLEARLTRPVFYELVELAQVSDGELAVRSGGASFPLGAAE